MKKYLVKMKTSDNTHFVTIEADSLSDLCIKIKKELETLPTVYMVTFEVEGGIL